MLLGHATIPIKNNLTRNLMEWKIKHVYNFTNDRPWGYGGAGYGFYGEQTGNLYLFRYFENFIGLLNSNDRFTWSAGPIDEGYSDNHVTLDLLHPHYICESPDGSILVTSNGNGKLFKIYPEQKTAVLFIDAISFGIQEHDAGNCIYDLEGNIWINDIRGCRVWKFGEKGEHLLTLGDGTPGFQQEQVSFDEVKFNWIYDLRRGPDGNIYVLDSKNFAVRKIDLENETVSTIVGTGEPGESESGIDALKARFGSNPEEYFDGPMSLSIDEDANIYIGDSFNHVLRMVENKTNIITTIAGRKDATPKEKANPAETDPLNLNIPFISSLEYYDGCLYIPEWDGDLIVLEKVKR